MVLIDAGQRKIAHNDLVAKVPKNLPDSIDEQPWESGLSWREREGQEREKHMGQEREKRSQREWVEQERRDRSEWGKEK